MTGGKRAFRRLRVMKEDFVENTGLSQGNDDLGSKEKTRCVREIRCERAGRHK